MSEFRGNYRRRGGGESRDRALVRPGQQALPAPRKEVAAKAKAQTLGSPDLWTTLQTVKDTATNWSKTTRAMNVPGGVLVNTCTRGPGFATEALVLVPHVQVVRRKESKTGELVQSI